ncbi:hypothetical protein J2X69_002440 [Algoriphagus sp. 4150]|uniref:glycosyltransferase n=1 Tax=Algoriphagus sp. 4150 TaxID=2817756 RepID=UPI002865A34A|nr:glycosyltransferase [Algoriphagus sp. 4150]MDR7130093.1 hypothetical protein [Algoriphagus sp. 4150]
MLSIIICSANKEYLTNLKVNISETVGCDFEILAYPNEKGTKGICEVYNQGIKEANYGLLCFMHEDIHIRTQNWGTRVFEIFSKTPSLGLLGVAGGDYKSLAPSSWYNFEAPANFAGKKYINLLQGYKLENKEPIHELNNPKGQQLSTVACVDGVWMCTRKSIAQEIKFDESRLKGFHGYDLDYSLAINNIGMEASVTYATLNNYIRNGSPSFLLIMLIYRLMKY